MLGDASLFTRADEVEAAWCSSRRSTRPGPRWDEEAATHTKAERKRDREAQGMTQTYAAGTWGPDAADQLIERDGRRWRRL